MKHWRNYIDGICTTLVAIILIIARMKESITIVDFIVFTASIFWLCGRFFVNFKGEE